MSIINYLPRRLKEILKSIYFTLAPKGSKLYSSTHTAIRLILNARYQHWIKRFDSPNLQDFRRVQNEISAMPVKPLISIIMPVFNTNITFLEEAIESVLAQVYPHWELCIADDASTLPGVRETLVKYSHDDQRIKVLFRKTNGHISVASNSALELATGEFVALLDHDDQLHPFALYYSAKEIIANPACKVIYSDEDKMTPHGKRIDPYFKSDFDLDLLLSQNMVSHLGVYKREAILKVGGFRQGLEGFQDYDLLLRILPTIHCSQIRHIPRVLYHWRISDQSVAVSIDVKPYALETGRKALCDHLASKHIDATVNSFEDFGYKIQYALTNPPPTVECFLQSHQPLEKILATSSVFIDLAGYDLSSLVVTFLVDEPNHHVLIDSLQANYPNLHVSVKFSPKHASNELRQAIENTAADYVVLIDDSCAEFSAGWLHNLISFADQPGIGCVSPKLIDKNGNIVSCGVILDSEPQANYLFYGANAAQVNHYFGWSSLHKGFSALPGACLVFKKAHYVSVGGFSTEISGQAARFFDLCLRMKQAGLRNVLIPEAVVTLDQSNTDQLNLMGDQVIMDETDKQVLWSQWKQWFQNDPAFNPNLTLSKGKPALAKTPRIQYP
jgi:cellulose synthase/poly-beta-1,6-N-acetylglucosamine synthase-like glycosyltransferase